MKSWGLHAHTLHCWLRGCIYAQASALGPCLCYAVVTLCLALHRAILTLPCWLDFPAWSQTCHITTGWLVISGLWLTPDLFCSSCLHTVGLHLSSEPQLPAHLTLWSCLLLLLPNAKVLYTLIGAKPKDRGPRWKFLLTFVSSHWGQSEVSAPFWRVCEPY